MLRINTENPVEVRRHDHICMHSELVVLLVVLDVTDENIAIAIFGEDLREVDDGGRH